MKNILIIGLPNSGKTILSKKLKEWFSENGFQFNVIEESQEEEYLEVPQQHNMTNIISTHYKTGLCSYIKNDSNIVIYLKSGLKELLHTYNNIAIQTIEMAKLIPIYEENAHIVIDKKLYENNMYIIEDIIKKIQKF